VNLLFFRKVRQNLEDEKISSAFFELRLLIRAGGGEESVRILRIPTGLSKPGRGEERFSVLRIVNGHQTLRRRRIRQDSSN
jgi:hypothetical protein